MVHHLPFSVAGNNTYASDLDCCNVTTPRSTGITSASPLTEQHLENSNFCQCKQVDAVRLALTFASCLAANPEAFLHGEL